MKFRVLLPVLSVVILVPSALAHTGGIPGPGPGSVKLEVEGGPTVSKLSGNDKLQPGGHASYRVDLNKDQGAVLAPTMDLGVGFVGKRFVGNAALGLVSGDKNGTLGLGMRADLQPLSIQVGPILSAGVGPEKANLKLDVMPAGGIIDRDLGTGGGASSAQLSGSLGLGSFAQLYGSAKGALIWPGMGSNPTRKTTKQELTSVTGTDGRLYETWVTETKVTEKGIPGSDKVGTQLELVGGVKVPLYGQALQLKAEAAYQHLKYKTGTGSPDEYEQIGKDVDKKNITGSLSAVGAF